MKNKLKIRLLVDKFGKSFYLISLYNKFNYKQYILKNDLLYTYFIIINFIYKYGFIKIKKNVYI